MAEQDFRAAILAAQAWLALGEPHRALWLLRLALRSANSLSPAHRRVTLRAMNWTRAAALRCAA